MSYGGYEGWGAKLTAALPACPHGEMPGSRQRQTRVWGVGTISSKHRYAARDNHTRWSDSVPISQHAMQQCAPTTPACVVAVAVAVKRLGEPSSLQLRCLLRARIALALTLSIAGENHHNTRLFAHRDSSRSSGLCRGYVAPYPSRSLPRRLTALSRHFGRPEVLVRPVYRRPTDTVFRYSSIAGLVNATSDS